ncbi:hypothetical protein ILYODFUR_038598, partial [Ilyodon furcidens]
GGCAPPSRRGDQKISGDSPASLGLAAERESLEKLSLPHDVVHTSRLYHSVIRIKVGSFSALVCRGRRGAFFMSIRLRDVIPPAADEQEFSFSTIKTYAAAISSCHQGFGDRTSLTTR